LFDISHMGRLTLEGPGAREWIDRVATNDASRLAEGQVQYSLLVNSAGGVIDDILVYRSPYAYTVVCNASNRARVLEQFQANRPPAEAVLKDRTLDTAMIAVQGPRAEEALQPLFDGTLTTLSYYHSTMGQTAGAPAVVSRTGYTGEDGFEVIVAADAATTVWGALLESGHDLGIQPCGLGARDTLRLEAGMPLYGHELDESIDPYEAGLGWAVKLDKGDFLGRDALRRLKPQPRRRRVGLALEGKRIARQGYAVSRDGRTIGVVTSGTFAPTIDRSIAMALVERDAASPDRPLAVNVRGQEVAAEVVPLPFYRRDPHGTHPGGPRG
jgi:aminomethyltransferase